MFAISFVMRIARNDPDRKKNGRRVYMRRPAISVRRGRVKVIVARLDTDMALLLCPAN